MTKKLVAASDFVKRQSAETQFTHFDGTWQELEALVTEIFQEQLDSAEKPLLTPGYRDGVWVLSLPENLVGRFLTFADYPMFEGMKLEARYAKTAGREHEPAKVQVMIREPKVPCKFVDIILYSHETLAEDKDNTKDSDWEIISINGRRNDEPKPMDPLTIVRNFLHLKGGTEIKGATPESVLQMLCESILHDNGLKHVDVKQRMKWLQEKN